MSVELAVLIYRDFREHSVAIIAGGNQIKGKIIRLKSTGDDARIS